jgi:hypothetical protein
MKGIVPFIMSLVVLVAGNAYATWDSSGNNVTQQVVKRFDHFPKLAPDGQGGAYVAWDTEDDWAPYDLDVAVCRMSSTGEVLWSAFPSGQAGHQQGAEVVGDGAGGAVVVWFDERVTGLGAGIYAQRYDSLGVAQWAAGGVRLSDVQPLISQPLVGMNVVGDEAGGAIIVWQDFTATIRANRVRGDGYLPWGYVGLTMTTNPGGGEYSCDAAADGSGGVLVTWQYGGVQDDVLAQRLDANGNRLWGNGAVYVKGPDADWQEFPSILPTSAGGAIVIWHELGVSDEVRAQRLDAGGASLWAPAGVTVSSLGIDVTEASARLVGDGSDGAFVIWLDNRNESQAADLLAVHLFDSGFVGSQNQLSENASRVEDTNIVSDGSGGAFVTWRLHDMIYGPPTDQVRVQWLDSALSNLLANGGEVLFDNPAAQLNPRAVLASAGRFVAIWEDERDQPLSTDCFARLVEGNTAPGMNVVVSPVDLTTGTTPVTLTFDDITSQGMTSLTTGPVGPPVPGTFSATGVFYHLTTTATFSDTVEVCIVYDPLLVSGPEGGVKLAHFDGTVWTNITTSVDTLANVVCGKATSLSPFMVGTGQIATAVGDSPRRFALHVNVPNPFNPTTLIQYEVAPGGAHVSISVYDVMGRCVRTLVDEHRAAGPWSVQWNGDDDRGQRVASGVYFYRMSAGEFVQTKKMVLLK